jgi:hypothetical protein
MSWNRYSGAWVAATTAGDSDLCAGDVELGNTTRPGVVDSKLLNSEKILAIGKTGREVESVRVGKGPAGAAISGSPLANLEP